MPSDTVADECSDSSNTEKLIHGVVFGRSVRAYFAIVHLADEEENHIVVRLQFQEDQHAKYLRSWCRRSCKFGDYVRVRGTWGNSHSESSMGQPRFIVNLKTPQDADSGNFLRVEETMRCGVNQCQAWQNKYCKSTGANVSSSNGKQKQNQQQKNATIKQAENKIRSDRGGDDDDAPSRAYRHGGGLGKRIQGEYVRNFLMNMIKDPAGNQSDPTSWATTPLSEESYNRVIQVLNMGSGVIDAAGGSGHVSMALGLAGIQSTIVDPRKSVGKLPGRDRKIWYRALKKETNFLGVGGDNTNGAPMLCGVCAKVVPFSTMKAWFANRPDGVDPSFRHPDEEEVPVCAGGSDLLDNCTAIVALHPDEATDAIVDMAVKKQIPFVVVPCCVFSRLFPHRRKPNGEQVSTYMDLLEYLCAKHKNIRKAKMPFDGANYLLWGTF